METPSDIDVIAAYQQYRQQNPSAPLDEFWSRIKQAQQQPAGPMPAPEAPATGPLSALDPPGQQAISPRQPFQVEYDFQEPIPQHMTTQKAEPIPTALQSAGKEQEAYYAEEEWKPSTEKFKADDRAETMDYELAKPKEAVGKAASIAPAGEKAAQKMSAEEEQVRADFGAEIDVQDRLTNLIELSDRPNLTDEEKQTLTQGYQQVKLEIAQNESKFLKEQNGMFLAQQAELQGQQRQSQENWEATMQGRQTTTPEGTKTWDPGLQAKYEQAVDAFQAYKINPRRAVEKIPKAQLVIAQILGAVGAMAQSYATGGRPQQSVVNQALDSLIANDMQVQQAELQQKRATIGDIKNEMAMYRQIYIDEQQAIRAQRVDLKQQYLDAIQLGADAIRDPKAKLAILEQTMAARRDLAKEQADMSMMRAKTAQTRAQTSLVRAQTAGVLSAQQQQAQAMQTAQAQGHQPIMIGKFKTAPGTVYNEKKGTIRTPSGHIVDNMERRELQKWSASAYQITEGLRKLRRLYDEYGKEVLPTEGKRRMQQISDSLKEAFRKYNQAGANLTGYELELMVGMGVDDPSKLTNINANARLDELERKMKTDIQGVQENYGVYAEPGTYRFWTDEQAARQKAF